MTVDSEVLTETRDSLRAVAVAVLAGPQFRQAGTIRLRAHPGGFSTFVRYGEVVTAAVEGTELVVTRVGAAPVRVPLAGTAGGLARAAGLEFGGLELAYPRWGRVRPERPVAVDPAAAAVLAAAWAAGDRALRAFGAAIAAGDAPAPVLWPEHFDIGLTLGEVNYGVSAGDDALAEPYAYVGPHRPRTGAFWNQPFGAARPLRDLPDEAALTAFFTAGHRAASVGV
jgi:hypothetical protein